MKTPSKVTKSAKKQPTSASNKSSPKKTELVTPEDVKDLKAGSWCYRVDPPRHSAY